VSETHNCHLQHSPDGFPLGSQPYWQPLSMGRTKGPGTRTGQEVKLFVTIIRVRSWSAARTHVSTLFATCAAERREWVVEEEDVRIAEDRTGDADALLLAPAHAHAPLPNLREITACSRAGSMAQGKKLKVTILFF